MTKRARAASMGFLSRCLFFTYSYSEESVDAILDRYSLHPYEAKDKPLKIKLTLPRRSVDVELSRELARARVTIWCIFIEIIGGFYRFEYGI